MKTSCFDAAVSFPPSAKARELDALLIYKAQKTSASIYFYEPDRGKKEEQFFVRIDTHKPLLMKWKSEFKVQKKGEKCLLGDGTVLNPYSQTIRGNETKKRVAFLQGLHGDRKDMLFTLIQEKGIHGLAEKEIRDFCSLEKHSLLRLSQGLEAEGKIKILAFSPLFLLSQASFNFLLGRILVFLQQFHKKNPDKTGVSPERIKKRFGLRQKILALALKHLLKAGEIRELGGVVALSDFKRTITAREESILRELEEMCFRGEFHSVSTKDLQKRFRLSYEMLHQLISLLVERKKIVLGKDGFILHSRWLDEIISRIRNSGKRELTVSDFKEMTGLTRKYAIPLLELLDQMRVTRRRGASREIL
jgi:selenocysteine-specific elongation factor